MATSGNCRLAVGHRRAIGSLARGRMPAYPYNREMEHLIESERQARAERPNRERPLVFLDSNVIIGYLRGDPSAVQIFSAQADCPIPFALNPLVLHELL